jgi:ABC-type uncharacterized transport system permease subunit
MPEIAPNAGQMGLLLTSTALFAVTSVAAIVRTRKSRPMLNTVVRITAWIGVAIAVAVLVWHSVSRGSWLPLEDNFDALTWLGVLLALLVLYVQQVRPLPGLDAFIYPVVVLLLVSAVLFGSVRPHDYVATTWSWMHRVSSYVGAVAFAVAGAMGAIYLINSRRLRSKNTLPQPGNGASLERLEHLTQVSVTLGFALLTVGVLTGVVKIINEGGNTTLGANWFWQPKVLLSVAVWVVYALVLHTPINPRLRGRKAATLSVVGFVLMVMTIIVVQFSPEVVR